LGLFLGKFDQADLAEIQIMINLYFLNIWPYWVINKFLRKDLKDI